MTQWCRHMQTEKAPKCFLKIWQGKKDSNLRMPESKSGALTNLATPLHRLAAFSYPPLIVAGGPTRQGMNRHIAAHPHLPAVRRRGQSQPLRATAQTLHCQNRSCVGLIQKLSAIEGLGQSLGTAPEPLAASRFDRSRKDEQRSPAL